MKSDKLLEIIQKLPIGLIAAAYMASLGWDYYSFSSSPDSPLIHKQNEIASVKKDNAALQEKLRAANEFLKTLDQKRANLRRLAQNLEELKGTISSEVDVPVFMKMVLTEAKRVGLSVLSIKPAPTAAMQYYQERPFNLSFRGVYVQLVVFLEHLANVQNVVRVDNFDMHPVGNPSSRYVELEGELQIKTYTYLGTEADEFGKATGNGAGNPGAAGGSAAKAKSGAMGSPAAKGEH